jgi:hypothetical protein
MLNRIVTPDRFFVCVNLNRVLTFDEHFSENLSNLTDLLSNHSCIFSNQVVLVDSLVEKMMVLSWNWLLGFMNGAMIPLIVSKIVLFRPRKLSSVDRDNT